MPPAVAVHTECVDTYLVFRGAHEATSKLLLTLIDTLMKEMKKFGGAYWSDREVFASNLRKVMLGLATCGSNDEPLRSFQLSGTTREKREALIKEVLLGWGASDGQADGLTRAALNADEDELGRVTVEDGMPVRRAKFDELTLRIAFVHQSALKLYERLGKVRAEVGAPFRGTAGDPDAGVAQVHDLLKRFPDVSDAIYKTLGYRNITSYPPQPVGVAFGAERIFMNALQEHADSEWKWEVFEIAGLVVASIAITLLTANTLGPLAATLVGTSIGLAQGAVQVVGAYDKLQDTKDANLYGAATDQSVQYAEGEVDGAWGMLVVNTATGGVLGRFGGGEAVSNAMKLLRVTGISAVGNGLATATNPNVWRSERTANIILFATFLGAATGAGGHVVAQGAMRLLPKPGAKVQIGVSKLDGHLTHGSKVRVQLRPDEAPVDAKVVSVNRADATVMLEVDGQNLRVRVGKAVKVQGSIFHDENFRKALRPMELSDFNPKYTPAYRRRPGQDPEYGLVDRRSTGELLFTVDDAPAQKVRLEELWIFEESKFVRPQTISQENFDLLSPGKRNYRIGLIPNRPNYFTAVKRNRATRRQACLDRPKLTIVQGHKTFAGWQNEDLPTMQIRRPGSKQLLPSPTPDEVAVFMAHGNKHGFGEVNTTQAARTMVDSIVDTNTRVGTKTPIRYCLLSSCQQGNRRFVVMGKTNAELFQQKVDMRLLELGINPKGSKRITVLASDRMGNLTDADNIPTFLDPNATTTFVPAGTQRPLSYPRDLIRLGLGASRTAAWESAKIVGVALVGGSGAIIIVAIKDPNEARAILRKFGNRIYAIFVDAPDRAAGMPKRRAGSR